MLTVKSAAECCPCECCGEPWYDECQMHYFECRHPGPHSDEDDMNKKKNPAAVELGRLGGKAKTDAKAAAARTNGKKGGWPKNKPKRPATKPSGD